MQKRDWRLVYTHNFPKLKSMTTLLEERLEQACPELVSHLRDSGMELQATFTPHFMTLFVYLTPIEIATRLFEIFILDGDMAIIRVILRMIELKLGEIMKRQDTEL